MTEKVEGSHKDFLRQIVEKDLKSNKYHGKVVTRFPPEPNGFPHIGHAKSICINFGIAKDYNGICHLRMDDTNPTTESPVYVEALKDSIRWLGFDWKDKFFYASDYFPKLYDYAVQLIKMKKAYVCSLTEEQIREYRGTVTEPGKISPYASRSIEENLDLLARMKKGEFKDSAHVLRARIDMSNANMKMRDPLLYRIRHAHHYRTGDDWCIYPMYDFAHCLSDYVEGITHSICTLEFENNRELYDWILDNLELKLPRPYQHEFARLNLNYTVMSKRLLLELVEKKLVSGWDDPRLPTIAGIRRRGYTPQSILNFCESIGIAKANSVVDFNRLEFCIRDDLNQKVPRVLCVLDPVKVVIENYPEGKSEMLDSSYYPHDVPKTGSRNIPFSREIYIERDDFMENPSKGYYRLSPGAEVRLRHAYIIKCEKVVKDSAGNVIELRCSYDPGTKSGEGTEKKVKGTIHWVSISHAKKVTVRLYDRLYKVEAPENLNDLNPDSLKIRENCFIEPAVVTDKVDERFQFERQGFFYIDPIDSKGDKLVFNQIVQLKDSWNSKSVAAPTNPVAGVKKVVQPVSAEIKELTETEKVIQKKYVDSFKISLENGATLARDVKLASFFDKAATSSENVVTLSNWIVNELASVLKSIEVQDLKFDAKTFSQLVNLVHNGAISGKIGKDIFEELVEKGGDPEAIVKAKGLTQVSDASVIESLVDKVISENPANVKKFQDGNQGQIGFFVGMIMKASGGKANPKMVNEILAKKLAKS